MRWSRGLWLLALVVGCGEGGPPLDELPLRDALRAEPEVVAGLPPAARARLAARLEAARTGDVISDPLGDEVAAPAALVNVLDSTRERRLADPLMVGAIADGLARPVGDRVALGETQMPALPVVEGKSAGATAPQEARALDGNAGTTVRALFAASGARRLSRVVGWPIGAIAIGDVVYVNASWLVALAPGDAVETDGGLDGPSPSESGATGVGATAGGTIASSAAGAAPSTASDGSASPAVAVTDAGTQSPAVSAAEQVSIPNLNPTAEAAGAQSTDGGTAQPPPSSPGPGFWDACGAGADTCGAAGDSCDDTTDDSSDDSCGGSTDDGSDDSCSPPPDDGDGCQIARGGRRTHFGTVLWLLAPLGFLLGRRP